MELLIMIDAFKRASAGRVTAVVPYYAYGRTDKKDQPRVPITARLLADLLTVAGASRILTVDLHAAQIQGFFNIPVDELTALYLLGDYFTKKKFDRELVVVATDIGITKRARDLAARLNAPLAIMEKRRMGNQDQAETLNVIGEVEGRIALTVDDEIDTAGSLTGVVESVVNSVGVDVNTASPALLTYVAGVGPKLAERWNQPVIIDKLSAEIARILAMSDIRNRLDSQGMDPFISSAEQFAALMKTDMVKWGKVIQTANVKADR